VRSEIQTAIGIARLAVALADSRQGADDIQSKQGIDIVTAADLAVEDLIRTKLAESFPDHQTVGEERGGVVQSGSPYWLVDPICGTRCYAANLPLYCTNIALVENDVVTAAVVGIGRSDEILYAERGSGAWLLTSERTASQIRVSDKSRGLWIGGGTKHMADTVRAAMLTNAWNVWLFHSTVSYAYLAMGRVAGLLQFASADWMPTPNVHSAAGSLIAEEAGAVVTDIHGALWGPTTQSFAIAANEALHRQLIELQRSSIGTS
jgi:myo-inositol-1(or 4)-monophosphatase